MEESQLLATPNPNWAFDDAEVWDLIASGGARAVHHIESPAMLSLCRQCHVRDIDTLIAIVSVIRPGAANEDKKREFARRYQGLSPVTYPHPSLEECLRRTYGLVVYEEHILQICEAFAGLPAGRADVLRRALVKEKQEVVTEIGREFAVCARARGHTEEEIARVWQLVTGFHGYAFCKAHSTAYGVEAYQSAWLKRYFPAEFMAAVLTNGKGFYAPLVYVLECYRLGLRLCPPWVNEPGPDFRPVPEAAGPPPETTREAPGAAPETALGREASPRSIRVPVSYLKDLTARTKDRIVAERTRGEYVSLADFHRRVGPLPEELEALIRVGAFDGFGQTRTAQFWEAQFLRHCRGAGVGADQPWLLAPTNPAAQKAGTGAVPAVAASGLPPLPEPTLKERLRQETELLGFPVSAHPLALYDDVAWETYCPVAHLGRYVGQRVVTVGLVIEQRLHHQTTGEAMKFLTLADWTGMVETELFAPTYRSYGLATVRYPVLEVEGTVEPFENGRGFSLRVHRAGRPRTKPNPHPPG